MAAVLHVARRDQRYLRRVEREGDQAEKSVADHEEMLELVRSGEYDVTEA